MPIENTNCGGLQRVNIAFLLSTNSIPLPKPISNGQREIIIVQLGYKAVKNIAFPQKILQKIQPASSISMHGMSHEGA